MNRVSEKAESTSIFGELQRFLAVCADAASHTRVELGAIWQELTQRHSVVVDDFFTHDRCYAALRSAPGSIQPRSRVMPKSSFALERVLLESADESTSVEHALRDMGVEGGLPKVPLLLMMAAHELHHRATTVEAQLSELVHEGVVFRIVGAPRPDLQLSERLDAAELASMRLLIEGRSLPVIAARCGTSMKEAESRLAAALGKLGVKNRLELLRKLVQKP